MLRQLAKMSNYAQLLKEDVRSSRPQMSKIVKTGDEATSLATEPIRKSRILEARIDL